MRGMPKQMRGRFFVALALRRGAFIRIGAEQPMGAGTPQYRGMTKLSQP